MKKAKVAVLASGRGSNFEALARADRLGKFRAASIELLIVNHGDAKAVGRAKRFGIEAIVVESSDRELFEQEVVALCEAREIGVLCLAGFMRLVGKTLLTRFEGRILNIHPSLLPAFPGLRAVEKALEHGVRVTGATVHLVGQGLDDGPILAQRSIVIEEGESTDSVSARLLRVEHKLYVDALRAVTERRFSLEGRRVIWHR